MQNSNTIITENTGNINYHFPTVAMKGTDLNKDKLEIAVIRFVQKLGIRPNLMGYHFLIKAIMLSLESPYLLSSLTKGLYPKVAEHYGKDVKAVERNMRRAIESAYEYDPERLRSVFYYKVNKPYISEVLSLAVELISHSDSARKYNVK